LTFADSLPTIAGMKKKSAAKPGIVKVGNVTVRIYERTRPTANGKRTIYEVSDYTSGVRRLRGFADHSKAKDEAERIARQLSNGEATAASFNNRDAASLGRALELLRPTGASLEVAASVYAKVHAIIGDRHIEAAKFFERHQPDKLTRKTVAQVAEELMRAKRARTKKGKPASERYLSDLKSRLNRFANDNVVDISTLTTADVQRWLDGLSLQGQTVKNFKTVLSTLFVYAERMNYILRGSNPMAGVEKIDTDNGEIEIFTPDEMTKLLESAPENFVPFLAIGAFAGLRSAEIERLDWSSVNLEGNINVGTKITKTRSRRLVIVVPNLKVWLARLDKNGKVWKGTSNDLQDARAETVKNSGVTWKDNGLRHSFISYRLAEINNAAQVALEAGNSEDMVFGHYRELVTDKDAKAWFSIVPKK
jgi:integrase